MRGQRSNYSRSNSNVLTTRIRFTRVLVGVNGPELIPNAVSGARSASAPLRGSALAWPHALPTTQRLSVGIRRTPFASAYLFIS